MRVEVCTQQVHGLAQLVQVDDGADAEQQAARIVEQAVRNAEQEGKAELETIRARMADTIVAELEKSLVERLDARTHQNLIDKSLTKVVLQ